MFNTWIYLKDFSYLVSMTALSLDTLSLTGDCFRDIFFNDGAFLLEFLFLDSCALQTSLGIIT